MGFVCVCVREGNSIFFPFLLFSFWDKVVVSQMGLHLFGWPWMFDPFSYLWVLHNHVWFIWVNTRVSDTVGKPSFNLVLICELTWSPTSAFWVMDSTCVPQRLAYRIVSGGLCISFKPTIYCVHPFPCDFTLFPSSTLKWNGQRAQMSSTSKVHGMCKSWWHFIDKFQKDLNELPNWKTVE